MNYSYEISRGRRLLTGAAVGCLFGLLAGFTIGRWAAGPEPSWPASFVYRDLSGLHPGAVRLCSLETRP